MNRKSWSLALLTGLIFFSLGCAAFGRLGALGRDATPEAGPPEPVEPQETVTSPSGDDSNGPAAAPLNGNLEALASYRAWLTLNFISADAQDQAASSQLILMQEVDTPQQARHLLMRPQEGKSAPGSFEYYQVPEGVYLISNENGSGAACMKMNGAEFDAQRGLVFNPGDFFREIERGKLVARGEDVNGIKADHYEVTKTGFLTGQVEKFQADVWVAQNQAFIARYKGWLEGSDLNLLNLSGKGRVEWDYYLEGVNTTQVALPQECAQAGMSDVPLPPNAENTSDMGPILSFTSPDSPAKVADFFRQELPKAGWEIQEDSGGGGLFSLKAQKGDKTLTILITPREGAEGSQVMITSL